MTMTLRFTCALLLFCGPLTAQETQGLVLPIKQVSVSSPVFQEVINKVLVEEGVTVTEGQPLVELRSEKEALEVERTQKLIELAQFKSKVVETLYKEKMGSKERWLEEQAQLDLAKILHRAAEVSLKEKTVRAPLSGIVVKKYKEAGESVERVEKLVDIVNIDEVFVQFYLDPKLMQSLKVDQPVTVRFPVINERAAFTGRISFIDPRIEATTGNSFRVKVLLANPDHQIKAGMRGFATFVGATATAAK